MSHATSLGLAVCLINGSQSLSCSIRMPWSPKKSNTDRMVSSPPIKTQNGSFGQLLQDRDQFSIMMQKHPHNSTAHKESSQSLDRCRKQLDQKLEHIRDAIAHALKATCSQPKKKREIYAALKDSLSVMQADSFDVLYELSSFVLAKTPTHLQSLKALRNIKSLHKHHALLLSEQEMCALCSSAFEKSLAILQVTIEQGERVASKQVERLTILESQFMQLQDQLELVHRSKEALFELAPSLFKKCNDLSRTIVALSNKIKALETSPQPQATDLLPELQLEYVEHVQATDPALFQGEFELIDHPEESELP